LLRYLWALPNTAIGLVALPPVLLTGGRVRLVAGVLEVDGGVAAPLLARLPVGGGAAAITVGHVVIARDAASMAFTRCHERAHVRQYELWGPFFIPAYLLASLWAVLRRGHAYHDNYFERDAVRTAALRHPRSLTADL
jgi:hypothetical protein